MFSISGSFDVAYGILVWLLFSSIFRTIKLTSVHVQGPLPVSSILLSTYQLAYLSYLTLNVLSFYLLDVRQREDTRSHWCCNFWTHVQKSLLVSTKNFVFKILHPCKSVETGCRAVSAHSTRRLAQDWASPQYICGLGILHAYSAQSNFTLKKLTLLIGRLFHVLRPSLHFLIFTIPCFSITQLRIF